MPIDRSRHDNNGDLQFVVRDPEHLYTHDEICDLLEQAEALGFSLEKGSELENMTVRDLEILVKRRQ